MKYFYLILLFVMAAAVSSILHFSGMILPWLFGAMIAAILFHRFVNTEFAYPKWLGSAGLIIIGAEIGSTFTEDTLIDMADDYMNIILLSVLIVALSLLLSRFFMKLTGCSYETAVLATIPGALSQMIVMAEEEEKADLLLVTLTQMSRIVLVVIIVPFIASLAPHGSSVGINDVAAPLSEMLIPEMIWIIVFAPLLIYILGRLKFPVPVMIGPMIAILVWNLTTGYSFSVDIEFLYAAQLLFGLRIGMQISTLVNQLNTRMIVSMIIQNVLLIFGTMILVFLFIITTDHQFTNLFLSAAPGGIGQIIIVAVEMDANIAMISSYHIFRIFFILLIIAPLINFMLKRNRYSEDS
ncbi:AbrB family transcriptional regulator [Salinicoccus jeotgali]|uniref:AbrB family transcriptional regulator n=1 Tax=Salinicoccus jeotgali TaxID=381634 RepID=A0ABP7EUU4_9STAP